MQRERDTAGVEKEKMDSITKKRVGGSNNVGEVVADVWGKLNTKGDRGK